MSIIKRKAGSEDIVKSVLEFDEVPTEGSHNLVDSGSVAQAIGNLGKPFQWKGPATVAELNAGITGIQPGWTYTLTDAGTLTDGSIVVDVGDEVAWTGTAWFKVGHDSTTEDIQKMIDDAVCSSEIAILSNITPAANTLRFSFSKKDYDPTVAGVGSTGKWTKLATTQANVWDWTRNNAYWGGFFRDAFTSSDNFVSVISCGALSTPTAMYQMFMGCTSLKYVCSLNSSNVTNFESIFSGCSHLEIVEYFDTRAAVTIQNAFYNCSSLKKLPLISSASAMTTVTSVFRGCVNVESGALDNYNTFSAVAGISSYNSAFLDCGKDTETGAAELAQIPQSWGGTMPNP